jgi:site-specific DNA recombinase
MSPEYDPGEDTTKEIAEIDAKLASLAASVTRFPEGSAALDALLREVDALTSRRNDLAARPYRPAGYRYRPTGKTFREYWDELDAQGRNQYLRNHKVRIEYTALRGEAPAWKIETLEIRSMVQAINATKADLLSEDMTLTEMVEAISEAPSAE